jgi:hypothetical protein
MSTYQKVYKDLENSIKETWFNDKGDDIEIIFYSGNQSVPVNKNEAYLDGNNLILPCDDDIRFCGLKTIMAFEWVLNNYEFDYLYRTNLGSYVDCSNLINFLSDKPKDKFYSGIVGYDSFYLGKVVKFASGSGYFLSSDLVNLVVSKKDQWNHFAIDDVALGDLMDKNFISIYPGAIRLSISDNKYIYEIGESAVEYIPRDKLYHIRLRSEDRYLDLEKMKTIYKNKNFHMVKLHYGGRDHQFIESEIYTPLMHYNRLCSIPSDINEHLSTLKKYGSECQTITEMGVRFACSTWAFIESKPKKLTCIDINYDFFSPSDMYVRKMCSDYSIDFNWITSDSLKVDIDSTDLLFIDTLHTYNQLFLELNKHHQKVNKYIILHDTTTFAHVDEGIYNHASEIVKSKHIDKTGLQSAIHDFLSVHHEWSLYKVYNNNNGLTILKRLSS